MLNFTKEHSKAALPVIAYAFFVCILYEWGFWGSFHVNILQFLSLSDIPRIAAYPISMSFALFLIGVLSSDPSGSSDTRAGGSHSEFCKIISSYPRLMALIVASVLLLTYGFLGYAKWLFICAFAASIISGIVNIPLVINRISPSLTCGRTLAFIITALPFMSFGYGKTHAEDILFRYTFATASIQNSEEEFIYLGHAGDYIILLTKDNKTTRFQRASDTPVLTIRRESNPIALSKMLNLPFFD